MIIIDFENLNLRMIGENDLEKIRHWRNADHVSSNMDYRDKITSEDQKKWFEDLDKKKNLYFIISTKEHSIGVLNIKDIDWDQRTAHAGVFIGEKEHLSTMMPIIAVFVLMKVCFDCFAMKELNAKIAEHNKNALEFNKQFGYKYRSEIKEGFDHFVCTKHSFYSTDSKMKKLHNLFNKNGRINISIESSSNWIIPYIQVPDINYHLKLV